MDIEIKESQIDGLGVFAKREFRKGEIIEECPILAFPKEQALDIDKTLLYNYYFAWEEGKGAIALGYGSLYNHSYEPNAQYFKDFKNKKLIFKCLKTIKSGNEVKVNYNGNPSLKSKVWFDVKELDANPVLKDGVVP